jgi:hypothetical protein
MGLRIAICGSAPSSVREAPFHDPNWQIWMCSPANLGFQGWKPPRIDLWFEMHSWSFDDKKKSNPGYYKWVQKQKHVVMQERDPDIPGSLRYPIEVVKKRWPFASTYFLTSSPALMMAMAILQKPDVIGMWGVDMAAQSEWGFQRPGCHRWIEACEAEGIAFVAPGESDILCPPPLYGFCESTHMWRKLKARDRELASRMAQAKAQIEGAQRTMLVLQGAHESNQYELRTWLPQHVDPRQRPIEQEVAQPPVPQAKPRKPRKPMPKRNSSLIVGKKPKARPNGAAPENQAQTKVGPGDAAMTAGE